MSGTAQQLLEQASQAYTSQQFAQGEALALQAWQQDNNLLPALLLAAICASIQGNTDAAMARLDELEGYDASALPVRVWKALVLRQLGRFGEALAYAEHALEVAPHHPEAQYTLAICLIDAQRPADAVRLLDHALSAAPENAMYHGAKGSAHDSLGDAELALKSYRRANRLSWQPEWAFRQALLELNAGSVARARDVGERLVQQNPESPFGPYIEGRVFQAENKDAQAEDAFRRSVEVAPTFEPGIAQLAKHAQSKGDFAEAISRFERCIELMPNQGSAYYGIATSKRITEEDLPFIERMRELGSGDSLSVSDAALLQFGLGKAEADLGNPAEAMAHYDRANALTKEAANLPPMDREELERSVGQKIELFTPEFISAAPRGSQSDQPVFVVGMMRSGTTLMEQILSCHPEVGGAGEIDFWPGNETQIVDFKAGSLAESALEANAASYLSLLQELGGEHRFITDKNPANVMSLGLIHLAFPNAKIIHMKRDPRDTMLSIWMTSVSNPSPFACDKGNIAFMYRQYQRLMDHWRTVIPSGNLLEVEYERLVSDPKVETRRVLEFLGLPWDDACARPQDNPRAVKTPSLYQVRQPIHGGSVGKWKVYEAYLGELGSVEP